MSLFPMPLDRATSPSRTHWGYSSCRDPRFPKPQLFQLMIHSIVSKIIPMSSHHPLCRQPESVQLFSSFCPLEVAKHRLALYIAKGPVFGFTPKETGYTSPIPWIFNSEFGFECGQVVWAWESHLRAGSKQTDIWGLLLDALYWFVEWIWWRHYPYFMGRGVEWGSMKLGLLFVVQLGSYIAISGRKVHTLAYGGSDCLTVQPQFLLFVNWC